MSTTGEEPWQSAVRDIVARNWHDNGRVSPLSFLGTELKRAQVAIPAFGLLKGAQSVQGIQAVQRPGHPLVWGLYPADVQLEPDLEKYFRSPATDLLGAPIERFVWQAFKTEIGGNNQRVIDFAEAKFFDVARLPKLSADQFIIKRTDQLPPADRLDKFRMYAHIRGWLDSRNLVSRGLQTAASSSTATSAGFAPRSLLDLLLEHLSNRDLQKIVLPMDVIERLRKVQV